MNFMTVQKQLDDIIIPGASHGIAVAAVACGLHLPASEFDLPEMSVLPIGAAPSASMTNIHII